MDIQAELSKFEPGSKERILLEKVLDKLGPNFTRKSVLAKAKEARQKRDEAMRTYFENKIVDDAVNKVVAEQEFVKPSSSVVHPVYLERAKKYLPEDETSHGPHIGGITQKDVPEPSELESAEFQALVSEKLKEFFIQLVECTGGTIDVGDWRRSVDKTLKELQSKIDFCMTAKRNCLDSRKQLKDSIKLYYEELSKGLVSLNKLLALHQEKLNCESATSELFMVHSYALSLKSRLFHTKLSLATYNIQTLPALCAISSELKSKSDTMTEEKKTATLALESYSQLGQEYDEIVDEIMQLTKRMHDEQYAIDHLKNHMPQQLDSSTLK